MFAFCVLYHTWNNLTSPLLNVKNNVINQVISLNETPIGEVNDAIAINPWVTKLW